MLYNPLDPHQALFNLISMAYGISAIRQQHPVTATDITASRVPDTNTELTPSPYLNITHTNIKEKNLSNELESIVFPIEAKITSVNKWRYDIDPKIIPIIQQYYRCRLINITITLHEKTIMLPVGFLLHPNAKYEKQTDLPLYLVFDGTLDNIDLSSKKTLVNDEILFGDSEIKVDKGFLKITKAVLADVMPILANYPKNRLIAVGHCYGAAIATLTSLLLKKSTLHSEVINLWTLAAPAMGNKIFVKELTANIKHIDSYHIHGDPVKTIPNAWLSDYAHHLSIDLSPYFDDNQWTDEFDKHHVNSIQTGYCELNQIKIAPLVTLTNYYRKSSSRVSPNAD